MWLLINGILDTGWEEHNADGATKSLTWEVGSELGTDSTVGTVCTGDLTPDCTELGTLGVTVLDCVDISNALTEVKLGVFLGLDVFELEDCSVGLGVCLVTSVCLDNTLDVELDLFNHSGWVGWGYGGIVGVELCCWGMGSGLVLRGD